MISKEEYRSKVASLINESEIQAYESAKRKRKRILSIALPLEFAATVIYVLIALFLFSNNSIHPGSQFSFIFFALPIWLIPTTITIVLVSFNKYDWKAYKRKYIDGLLSMLFDGYKYTYDGKKFIDSNVFKESPYYTYYDHYYGEDLISVNIPNDDGTPSDTIFNLSDLVATAEEKDQDGHTKTVTVFDGLFGYIEFPFEFKCTLGINHKFLFDKKMEKLTLEDIAFNKGFKAITNNPVEALVILTPSMIQKLKTLKDKIGWFSIVLINNKLYMEVRHDLFELKRPKKEFNEEVFDKIYEDVSNILSIVEEIKTNNKIFKM